MRISDYANMPLKCAILIVLKNITEKLEIYLYLGSCKIIFTFYHSTRFRDNIFPISIILNQILTLLKDVLFVVAHIATVNICKRTGGIV